MLDLVLRAHHSRRDLGSWIYDRSSIFFVLIRNEVEFDFEPGLEFACSERRHTMISRLTNLLTDLSSFFVGVLVVSNIRTVVKKPKSIKNSVYSAFNVVFKSFTIR